MTVYPWEHSPFQYLITNMAYICAFIVGLVFLFSDAIKAINAKPFIEHIHKYVMIPPRAVHNAALAFPCPKRFSPNGRQATCFSALMKMKRFCNWCRRAVLKL